MVTRRVFQILIDAQISLRCRERRVPVAQLDLLDFGAALVGQFAVGPPQIVRLQRDRELLSRLCCKLQERLKSRRPTAC